MATSGAVGIGSTVGIATSGAVGIVASGAVGIGSTVGMVTSGAVGEGVRPDSAAPTPKPVATPPRSLSPGAASGVSPAAPRMSDTTWRSSYALVQPSSSSPSPPSAIDGSGLTGAVSGAIACQPPATGSSVVSAGAGSEPKDKLGGEMGSTGTDGVGISGSIVAGGAVILAAPKPAVAGSGAAAGASSTVESVAPGGAPIDGSLLLLGRSPS